MAVAMEVAWRGAELGNSPVVLEMSKKRTWGADTEKLMQLMMGQFGSSSSPAVGGGDVKQEVDVTLDLLGTAAGSSPASGTELDCHSSAEFLELDPDQPLPSGWEKCLDLKVSPGSHSLETGSCAVFRYCWESPSKSKLWPRACNGERSNCVIADIAANYAFFALFVHDHVAMVSHEVDYFWCFYTLCRQESYIF